MTNQPITDEDAKLLKNAGSMGHDYIGIVGPPGARRTSCECNSPGSAQNLCSERDLIVYERAPNNGWRLCYDRLAAAAALAGRK
jgi:hypothetical protein